jgi:hypothetical protein
VSRCDNLSLDAADEIEQLPGWCRVMGEVNGEPQLALVVVRR